MRFAPAASFVALLGAAFVACVGEDPALDSGPRCGGDAPCGDGLTCVAGRCVPAEAGGVDSGAPDTADSEAPRKPLLGVWSADLLAYWPFDEDGRDYGPSHFDLALGAASFEPGVTNGALRRSTTTSATNSKDDAVLDLTSGSFTIQLWTYLDVDTDDGTVLLNKMAGTDPGGWKLIKHPALNGDAGGSWQITFATTPNLLAGSVVSTPAGPTKTWVHLVMVFLEPNGTMTVYRNGVAAGTASIAPPTASTTRFRVGESVVSTTTNLVGLVDEVAIWKRGMTSVEVSLLYNEGKGTSFFAPEQ